MPDVPPPRFSGDERSVLIGLWRYQRESFLRTVAGLSDSDAKRHLVTSTTTLLWLTQHLADAEQVWVLRRLAGRNVVARAGVDETLSEAVLHLRTAWSDVDAIIENVSFDDTFSHEDGTVLNVRWVVAHLLEEVARHAGHADILRELIDGATGR